MKHLKKFDDVQFANKLKDQFSNELSYILDDDELKLTVSYSGFGRNVTDVSYCFTLSNININYYFSWLKIKDHFIAFIQRIDKEFIIEGAFMGHEMKFIAIDSEYSHRDSFFISKKELIGDDEGIPELINSINFYFKVKI